MRHNGVRVGVIAFVVVAAGYLAYEFWRWEVERVEVPPASFLVRVHLWGKNLPEGEILAPDDSHKGILLDVLPEGRHFLNPLVWKYELHPMRQVPPGKCLVLSRKHGKPIPAERIAAGDVLARDGERGILRDVLLPGNHRINPYAYDVQEVDATEVRGQQVGVRTLKVGNDPRAIDRKTWTNPYLVPEGYRGVQAKQLPSGTYYLNPYVESIAAVDMRSHRVEFADIEFPSKDGFILRPHVLVTYRVIPEKAPELFVTLAEESMLEQRDSTPEYQEANPILQKIVLPLIRGYVRIEGSNFDARDFITVSPGAQAVGGNARERLQHGLDEKVVARCEPIGIKIESITIAQMDAPTELAAQIAERELARVERERNQDRIGQYKTEQELKATEALTQQNQAKVAAQTRLIQEKTKAQQRKDIEESKLKTELENAKIQLEAARNKAKEILATGKAEADVINLQNEAEVAGLKRAVQGFPSADAYAQFQIIQKIGPALTEIFASDASEFAKLFANYLTPTTPGVTPRAEAAGESAGGVKTTADKK